MKTILICHKGNVLTEEGFARWLSSFSDLVGIVKIQEDGSRSKQRIEAEIKRSGLFRFVFDILPYRLYDRIMHRKKDAKWIKDKVKSLSYMYPYRGLWRDRYLHRHTGFGYSGRRQTD